MPAGCRDIVMLVIETSIRSLLVAAVAAALRAVWRPRHGAIRHHVWTMVLAGMLLMPLLSVVLPRLAVPVLPAASPAASVPSVAAAEHPTIETPADRPAASVSAGAIAPTKPLLTDETDAPTDVERSLASRQRSVGQPGRARPPRTRSPEHLRQLPSRPGRSRQTHPST